LRENRWHAYTSLPTLFHETRKVSKTGGAKEQGIENEDQVLAVLGKYLKRFLNNQYSIETKSARVWAPC
jgi:hypothetical protein